MRNGSLWSDKVFKKEVNFHKFDLKTSELDFEVSKFSIWKHTATCDKGVFSFIIILQLRRPIELKFSPACYLMHCWETLLSEKTGLWQVPIVSNVFNVNLLFCFGFCTIFKSFILLCTICGKLSTGNKFKLNLNKSLIKNKTNNQTECPWPSFTSC